jgi:hypothetical protein
MLVVQVKRTDRQSVDKAAAEVREALHSRGLDADVEIVEPPRARWFIPLALPIEALGLALAWVVVLGPLSAALPADWGWILSFLVGSTAGILSMLLYWALLRRRSAVAQNAGSIDDILRPVWEERDRSGMSEEELERLIDHEVRQARKERRAKRG